jgi:hypothetical protein
MEYFRSLSLSASLPLAVWLSSGWLGLILHWNPTAAVLRGFESMTGALRSVWDFSALESATARLSAGPILRPVEVPVAQTSRMGRSHGSWL